MTPEQTRALAFFARDHGRLWRRKLALAWESGFYPADIPRDEVPTLQSIRNTLGPSGLVKIPTPARKVRSMRKLTRPEVLAFCERIKVFGFIVELAESKDYGFITDDTESRVLSFSFNDGGYLSGNYGPPTTKCGTGWRMDGSPWDLKTAENVRAALHAPIPNWIYRSCRDSERPVLKHSTVAEYRAMYQSSSRFERI